MAIIELEILGDVVGKQRPRITKNGHVYTPNKTAKYEAYIRLCFQEKYPNFKPLEEPIKLEIEAYYPIPKSASKKQKELMLQNKVLPTKKPDLDNVLKSVLDALNGIAYKDDVFITDISISKRYAEMPKIVIKIEKANCYSL